MKNIIPILLGILILSACSSAPNGPKYSEDNSEKTTPALHTDAGNSQQSADLQKALDLAPRRDKNEGLSVGLVVFKPASSDLAAFHEAYTNMIYQEARRVGLPVIDSQQMNQTAHFAAGDVGPLLAQKIRMLGVKPDIMSYISIGTKTKTGVLKGSGKKKGAAIAQAQVPEFQVKVTSAYNYQPKEFKILGKSLTNINLAGVNAAGKTASAILKSKRKIETDRPAIRQMMLALKKSVAIIAPTLPAAPAVMDIEKNFFRSKSN